MTCSSIWRTQPVFIASTFRDMQAEHDHLLSVVFPELEERLRERRVFLEPINLRWEASAGNDAEEHTKEMQRLKVCLAEVKRSRPFFVALLGDRYGWIPPAECIQAATREACFQGRWPGSALPN